MAKKLREPEAINNMGLMYEGGFDATISDPDRAKEHYELAHKLGNTDASMNLALMYLNNMYMDTDIQYAVYLLKGAARNGNVKAKDYLLANGYITDISEKGFNESLERALVLSINTMHREMLGYK